MIERNLNFVRVPIFKTLASNTGLGILLDAFNFHTCDGVQGCAKEIPRRRAKSWIGAFTLYRLTNDKQRSVGVLNLYQIITRPWPYGQWMAPSPMGPSLVLLPVLGDLRFHLRSRVLLYCLSFFVTIPLPIAAVGRRWTRVSKIIWDRVRNRRGICCILQSLDFIF